MQRQLIVWLLAVCGLAFFWPQLQRLVPGLAGFDPFLSTTATALSVLIAVTMFCVGMMLPRNEVAELRSRWPSVLFGTGLQYTTMPLLAVGIGKLCGLEGEAFAGVVMVGCVPGAMASNVITLNARGHTSFSVSLTTSATLLSPLAVPLLLGACLTTERAIAVPMGRTSLQLLLTVVAPVLVGYLVNRRLVAWESRINRVGTLIANLTIVWIIATVVGATREKLAVWDPLLLGALLAVNLLGYAAGYFGGALARLPESMRRALTVEIGMQNAGLGAVLAKQIFGEASAATIAPAMYTFGCMFTGTLLARAWSRYDPNPGRSAEPSASEPVSSRE